MKRIKTVNLLSALLMTGIFSCTQPTATVLNASNTKQTQVVDSASQDFSTQETVPVVSPPVISTIDSTNVSSTILSNNLNEISEPLTSGSTFDPDEVKDALIVYNDMDAVFSESEALSEAVGDNNIQFSNFSTKSVGNSMSTDNPYTVKTSNSKKVFYLNNDLRESLLESINKVRNEITNQKNNNMVGKQTDFKNKEPINMASNKNLLVHRSNDVKCSKEISMDNKDGTYIKNNEFQFNRGGVVRVNREGKTYDKRSGKLTKISHNFESRTADYTQVAVRVTTFNNNGGRTISTECTQKYFNGKTRVIHESKEYDKYGKGSGNGMIKINYPSGKTCNYNLNIIVNLNELTSTVKNPQDNTEVSLTRRPDGKSNLLCRGKKTVIDIDYEVSKNTKPIPLPTPTYSPTANPSDVPATSEPTAIPTSVPTATVAPTAIPTVAPTATAIPTSVPTATVAPTAIPTVAPTATAIPTSAPTATAAPTAIPTVAPTSTATPVPTASPTEKPKDDNGHGNDPGKCDPSNPGNSNPDCQRV